MLAGLPVPADAADELAGLVRDAGADDLADRLVVYLARAEQAEARESRGTVRASVVRS